MLTGVDIMMLIDTVVTYKLMRTLVTQITYKPQTDEIEVTHLNNKWLSPVTQLYKPLDLLKFKKKSLNFFVGYKVIATDQKFSTECGLGEWTDRKFLDSIVHPPIVKAKKPIKNKLPPLD